MNVLLITVKHGQLFKHFRGGLTMNNNQSFMAQVDIVTLQEDKTL